MADTGYKFPTTFGSPSNQFTSGNQLGADDSSYATDGTVGHKQDTATYGFGIPAGSTINSADVEIQGTVTTGNNGDNVEVDMDLSWNGGTNYGTAEPFTFTKTTPLADETFTVVGSVVLGGHAWVDTDFSTANFRVRLTYISETRATNAVRIDYIKIKIHYTPPGAASPHQLTLTSCGV